MFLHLQKTNHEATDCIWKYCTSAVIHQFTYLWNRWHQNIHGIRLIQIREILMPALTRKRLSAHLYSVILSPSSERFSETKNCKNEELLKNNEEQPSRAQHWLRRKAFCLRVNAPPRRSAASDRYDALRLAPIRSAPPSSNRAVLWPAFSPSFCVHNMMGL